ncbi:hypothetical protein KCU78_g5024, partial [Aureobasidium melanogenum]
LRGKLVSFDLSTPSTLINPGVPLDQASVEVEVEQEGEAVNDLFDVHAELIRPASVVSARHISRGRPTIPVPGQDRGVIIDQKRTPVLHNLLDLNTNCPSSYPQDAHCSPCRLHMVR